MRLTFLVFLTLVLLSGCTAPASPAPTAQPVWSPPAAPSEPPLQEAESLADALALCKTFAENAAQRYPDYAPTLSEEDVEYYERRLRDASTDWESLTAEMTQTILSLRQQIYRKMEASRKSLIPLPDGLEAFVRDYEAAFFEIGW